MENTEAEEKLVERNIDVKPDEDSEFKMKRDCNQDIVEMSEEVELPTTSESLAKKECSVNLVKLTQRKKEICNKLAIKRQQLQMCNNIIESNSEEEGNEFSMLESLQNMALEDICKSNQIPRKTSHRSTKCNGILLDEPIEKPLQQYSRKDLARLVGGFQELIYKLTNNDAKLKYRAEKIACNISCLRNFQIFSNVVENKSSASRKRYRKNSDFYYEEVDSVKEQEISKEFENKKELSPTEKFVKYINSILSEYFGEQEKDKIDMYRCSPTHIEDLETFAADLVKAGIGSIVESEIRINRKNNAQAFVSMSEERESNESDAMILSAVARRYAFDGDIIRAFVLHRVSTNVGNRKVKVLPSDIAQVIKDGEQYEEECIFDDSENVRKAFVIRIVKETKLREVVGSISFINPTTLHEKEYYKLKPHDMRVPMIYIPVESCKEEVKKVSTSDVCGMLYLVRVLETDSNGHCIGTLVQPVGKVGNLEAEIKAILLHNGLKDIQPYDAKFNDMYEGPMPVPNEDDLKHREDLRKKCIFTIDPLTAKDLDDAVSVEKLSNSVYEIGVHISDVSFYLEENSELDNLVKLRATSIYLVNEVIHMLPPSLCFRCSLLPGEDKFAFSIFWEWNEERGELSQPRFTRSIINSCSQLAYEHAQRIIDNPTEELDRDNFPDLLNGWTSKDIQWRILFLHQIAQKLKAKRYENGALSINNPKLRFQLDPKTGEPLAYEIESRQEANFLIEELMLLANQAAAKFIHDFSPEKSILRNHSPPLTKSMKALKERLKKMNLEFDITSSKSIFESMNRLSRESDDPEAVEAFLNSLLTKPMARARYYCSEGKTSDADFWHYALSLPIYTHFTSPIRRYPDIMVHRLLAAALNYCPSPQMTTDELHHLAKICNDQKFNAKTAGDESIELFFKRYIKANKSITLKAVVLDIYNQMLNVVIIKTGHLISINYNRQKFQVDTSDVPSSVSITPNNSQYPPKRLTALSTVDVKIMMHNDKITGYFVKPDTNQMDLNTKKSSEKKTVSKNNNCDTHTSLERSYTSEQEIQDDNSQTTSSLSKRKSKHSNAKRKHKERLYAFLNKQL